jgi:hypothetical protein
VKNVKFKNHFFSFPDSENHENHENAGFRPILEEHSHFQSLEASRLVTSREFSQFQSVRPMAPKKVNPPSLEELSRLARELHRRKAKETVPKASQATEAAAPPSIAAEPCEAPPKRRRVKGPPASEGVAPPANVENKSGHATAEPSETKVDKTPAELPGSKVDKSYKEIPRSKVDKSYKEIPHSKVDKSCKEIPHSKVDKSYKEIPRPKASQKKTNRTKLMEDKRVKLARGKSKILTAKDMDKAEEFDPSHLPFQVTWQNFKKLQEHYKLSEAETTSILLAMVGPSPGAEKYWSKYRVPKKYASGNEIGSDEADQSEDPTDTMPEPDTVPANPAKPADDEVDGEPMSDEDTPSEDDDDLLSSTGSSDRRGPPPPCPRTAVPGGSPFAETEHHERVKQPVDEEVVLAKHALEQSLQAVATPAKAEPH